MVKIKVESLTNEPVQNEIAKDESSSEGEPPEPIQEVKANSSKKAPQQKMVSCPNCGKEMLQKTFRYYHSLKCKPQQEEPATVAPPRPETIEVSFDGRRSNNVGKFQSLLSKAF
jgi:hypothetical protein